MSNEQLNGKHGPNLPSCYFSHDFQERLIGAIEGMRDDYKEHYQKVVDRGMDRAENSGMIPIKSHYMILIGGLIVLLGVAVVKEFITKT